MAPLLSREKEHELCISGRLSSNIIRGPTPFRKRSTSSSSPSQTFFAKQHSHEERELLHSRPQFRQTTLGKPGTMTPHLASKYDDDELHF